jgi:hypothetical protein
MAQRVQISCINKTPRLDPHERIRKVGGVNGDGTRWSLDVSAAIQGIEAGKWSFYVHQPGVGVVDVVIATRNGHKYLKTKNDGEQPNNLLALPECP